MLAGTGPWRENGLGMYVPDDVDDFLRTFCVHESYHVGEFRIGSGTACLDRESHHKVGEKIVMVVLEYQIQELENWRIE